MAARGDVRGSQVRYDLLGEITSTTQLTRRTIATILGKVTPPTFGKFLLNPEQFIAEAPRLINEQKAAVIAHLTHNTLEDRFSSMIFAENQTKQDFAHAGEKLTRHIYDYVITDSRGERDLVTELSNALQEGS